ncbi:MAG TPA: DUF2339 domain-containing protein [Acidobacteriaceae bacterium]|jgi:uncharacterized membrane protein
MSDGPENPSAEERALRLEAQLAAVTARVWLLEREVAVLRGGSPPSSSAEAPSAAYAQPAAQPQTSPQIPTAAATAPAAEPPTMQAGYQAVHTATPVVPPKPREEQSLESRVGSQWFNRIGIIALLIGVAWFLKFAFDNHWVGPAGRVLIGLLSGAALIAWSERFRTKGYTAFSYSLKAAGSGVLYLSLWAAFSMYHLVPAGVAFTGMILVTAFNAFIAWRQSAELLAVYAIVGAFSTPLLLSTGHNEEVFLFSYLLMMNAATMALLVLKGWNRLLVLSFVGTVAFFWGWYWQFYAPAEFVTTAVFLSLFVLLFAAATIVARQRRGHPVQDDAARVLVSLANAAFGFLGFYAMLSQNGGSRNTALAWCSVGFGAFYLGVRKLMERTPIEGSRLASLSDIQLSIAIVFLTLAVPLAVHGHWVTVGWMAEGAVLVWVATRMRTRLMEVLAAGALTLGLISLAMDATIGQTHVLWNTRFLSFAVSIAALTVSALLAHGAAAREKPQIWETLAAACAVTAQLLVVIAGLLEIHTFWWSAVPAGHYGANSLLVSNTLLTSAIWLVLISALAHWIAIRRPLAAALRDGLRWEAIGLLACGVLVLFGGLDAGRQTVFLNLRFVTFLIVIGALAWTALLSGRAGAEHGGAYWRVVSPGSVLAANVLALVAVCFEISTFWATRAQAAAPGSQLYYSALADRNMAERFSYSAWFLLAGAALLATGFRRQSAWLRWQGLVLLAVTICKVFLLDTSTLSQGYRIISFLALGALLLAVSFAYQRDWLHLRAAGATNGGETK